MKLFTLTISALFFFSFVAQAQQFNQNCYIPDEIYTQILEQVSKKNPEAIKSLPDCFRFDRKLILKASMIDPEQFQNASDNLKEDEIFVHRLLKVSPQILKFASQKLRINQTFMEQATYLNRNALQYADPKLLDNKLFIKRMIKMDAKNYEFASDRLKEVPEFAETAFTDNGLLLEFATPKIKADKNLVKIAIQSNNGAIEFASDELKEDPELKQLATLKTSIKSVEDLTLFLKTNYLSKEKKKNLGLIISNQAKNFPKQKIINRNYVTKWQRSISFYGQNKNEDLHLITAESRNYPIFWKEDFRKYPDLITKIEKFFASHNIDHSTIDNISTTYFWKIKEKPLTFAFNIYLLRDSKDNDLGPEFANITSLTAIVQKQKDKWRMTVVEVIFDSEMKVEVGYANGHKKYVLWDLYETDKEDKNPKIIFKVEDKFKEYFEIFEEQSGGKYQMVQRVDALGNN
jgi:hypothetical protein